MPQKIMAADDQPVRSSEVDKLVSAVEVKVSSRGLSGIPLHTILGRNGTKIRNDGICVLGIGDIYRIGDGTKIQLALCLEELVDAGQLALNWSAGYQCHKKSNVEYFLHVEGPG